jgi:uncharacterized membrane protein (UPF0127 family)
MKLLLSPRNIIIGFILLLVLIVASYRSFSQTKKGQTLSIGNKITINIDIADTNAKRAKGYSNHAPISYNEGLLFVFPVSDFYAFWMQDMLFDLDFIYIEKGRVVHVIENVPAPINNGGEVEYVNSPIPFSLVLEVKSGFIKKYGIKKNDAVTVN